MRELLIDTLAHIAPARALESLTADDAERRLPGASHSIAEIVAHIDFWQRWFCARCEGSGEPMIARAALRVAGGAGRLVERVSSSAS